MRSRWWLSLIVLGCIAAGPAAPAHGEGPEQAPLASDPDNPPSNYFGTNLPGYTTFTGKEFTVTRATQNWDWGTCRTAEDLSPYGNGPRVYRVLLEFPDGARFHALRWWASDTDPATDLTFLVQEICHPRNGAGPPVTTNLANGSTAGSGGDQSGEILMPSSLTVRAKDCTYSMTANFGFINCAQILDKIRVEWFRQISPAPATARFLDVPANHPFFRFVEALAASGITGGCAPNQYCPDSNITRGQMAVFLSTALGLSWNGP